MPRVISLIDKSVATVFDKRDFEYFIEKYMGYDALRYYQEIISDYEHEIEELRSDIEDLKNGSKDCEYD